MEKPNYSKCSTKQLRLLAQYGKTDKIKNEAKLKIYDISEFINRYPLNL